MTPWFIWGGEGWGEEFTISGLSLSFSLIRSQTECNTYSQSSSSVLHKDSINELIILKLNPLVFVDWRFISAFLYA